jgi:hypothetical protein
VFEKVKRRRLIENLLRELITLNPLLSPEIEDFPDRESEPVVTLRHNE